MGNSVNPFGSRSSETSQPSVEGCFSGKPWELDDGERQFSVDEVLQLQTALKEAFAEESFQRLRRRADTLFPQRGVRGHEHAEGFSRHLHELLNSVYRVVLPRKPWCLRPGNAGARTMMSRMTSVSEDSRIIKMREEINTLLGLPKQMILRPPPEEPVFVLNSRGGKDATVISEYTLPLLMDVDGDQAHEFWEEDPKVGTLFRVDIAARLAQLARARCSGPGSNVAGRYLQEATIDRAE